MKLTCVFLLAANLVVSLPASGTTIPGSITAMINLNCPGSPEGDSQSLKDLGALSCSNPNDGSVASGAAKPYPSVQAKSDGNAGFGGAAEIQYQWSLNGKTGLPTDFLLGLIPIPVDIQAQGSAAAGLPGVSGAGGDAEADVSLGSLPLFNGTGSTPSFLSALDLVGTDWVPGCLSEPFPDECHPFGFNKTYEVAANIGSTYGVFMIAVASGGGASAEADPVFQVDPAFAYADDVSIVFSPGILNQAPPDDTPEPGTIVYALSALLLVALKQIQKTFLFSSHPCAQRWKD